MGPRVQVSPEEFVEIANVEGGLVIRRKKMYVIRSGDYYYYTTARQPLTFSDNCKIQEAKNILL